MVSSRLKNAHHPALKLAEMDRPSSSLSGSKSGWGFLWSRRIPSKVKTFGWKLCKGALALMGNLSTKNPEVADICPVCKARGEDVLHAFITCSVARQTWAFSSLPWAVVSSWQGDATQWFCGERADRIVCSADQLLQEFVQCSQALQRPEPNLLQPVLWSPPLAGVVKINYDGATFAELGMAGVGVVARDSERRLIKSRQRLLEFKASLELAELIAAATTVDLGCLKGWRKIILKGDCISVTNKLTSDVGDDSHLGIMLLDVKNKTKEHGGCWM
ncbi:putative ribonuclease H protein [Sesamum alatum]|uniref:Ribonuclease H protein n=1 Tax=Sesamum alatum TaxID=300844 RepID=A0AAE2CTZ0_9LAMI|nr:putative ribonuclease H protein [Sesamum alatum]